MISDQEKLQIREVVDQVVETRLLQFSEVQLTLISDMLLKMTDHYVEALMNLARVIGLPERAAIEEGKRMSEIMLEGLKRK